MPPARRFMGLALSLEECSPPGLTFSSSEGRGHQQTRDVIPSHPRIRLNPDTAWRERAAPALAPSTLACACLLTCLSCSDPEGGAGTGGADRAGSGGAASGGTMSASGGTGGLEADGSGGAGATNGSAGALGTGGGDGGGGNTSAGSPGCGATNPPASGTYSIDVDGQTREYILDVPEDYDTQHPYPVVFGWHWRGGDAGQVADGEGASFGPYYGLKALANGEAIFVAPEGLTPDGVSGWANQGGEDIAFAEEMVDHFEHELCIDTERVFSTGFSYGGMFSYAVGCALADRFRAIAPYSGALWSGCEDGSDPIAMWGAHGVEDAIVEIEPGRQARDEFLERNGCTTSPTPTDPEPCVSYEGCDAGYPVVWCEYDDGHWPPSFAAEAVWDFFSQF